MTSLKVILEYITDWIADIEATLSDHEIIDDVIINEHDFEVIKKMIKNLDAGMN